MFDVRRLEEPDDVVAEAVRLAEAGAEEGTVVVAETQAEAVHDIDARWVSPPGNLHLALVLQPEYGNGVLPQVGAIALVAAGESLAEVLEPMTGLGYRMPGQLLINDLLGGAVRLTPAPATDDPLPWLVVGFHAHVAHHPPNPEPDRFNSVRASGTRGVDAAAVAEGFCRYFLRWINIWAEDGFDPVWKALALRLNGEDPLDTSIAAGSAALEPPGRDDALRRIAKAHGLPAPRAAQR